MSCKDRARSGGGPADAALAREPALALAARGAPPRLRGARGLRGAPGPGPRRAPRVPRYVCSNSKLERISSNF